jgi:hypothetical protein
LLDVQVRVWIERSGAVSASRRRQPCFSTTVPLDRRLDRGSRRLLRIRMAAGSARRTRGVRRICYNSRYSPLCDGRAGCTASGPPHRQSIECPQLLHRDLRRFALAFAATGKAATERVHDGVSSPDRQIPSSSRPNMRAASRRMLIAVAALTTCRPWEWPAVQSSLNIAHADATAHNRCIGKFVADAQCQRCCQRA